MTRRPKFRRIEGSITAPRGFKAAAVYCDIKRLGTGKGSEKGKKRDLALIVSDVPASVAGMFTTNQVAAAPVKLSAKRAAQELAQAVVVNSRNANACTGKQGVSDAREMTRVTAKALGLREKAALVCSTGRIGAKMPMANVKRGIRAAAPLLRADASSAHQVAEAIMTSDTRPKEIAVDLKVGATSVRIAGICKGAGMIQPQMTATGLHATMLGFVTTDAAIESPLLKRALATAVAQSFNRITVDGDMSTNDTVLVLANGLAQNEPITSQRQKSFLVFQEALNFVTLELAKMIVLDGEGVSRFVTVHVHGARTFADADDAARSIANSVLVKTSWCGGDPNWGRVLCALGYSRARIDELKVDIAYRSPNDRLLYGLRRGQPSAAAFKTLMKIVGGHDFEVHVFLNVGRHEAIIYASDLTENYVAFNKGDVSDPRALGG